MASLLVLNAGSSSIEFAIYSPPEELRKQLSGPVAWLGQTSEGRSVDLARADAAATMDAVVEWIDHRVGFSPLRAAGHRGVHGLRHSEPVAVTPELTAEFQRISSYDPEHLPREIAWMRTLGKRYPKLPQAAGFNATMGFLPASGMPIRSIPAVSIRVSTVTGWLREPRHRASAAT